MLILTRKLNESIIISDMVEITIVDIKGDQVKLGIKAPKDVKVYRKEVYNLIQEENKAAASIPSSIPNLSDIINKKD